MDRLISHAERLLLGPLFALISYLLVFGGPLYSLIYESELFLIVGQGVADYLFTLPLAFIGTFLISYSLIFLAHRTRREYGSKTVVFTASAFFILLMYRHQFDGGLYEHDWRPIMSTILTIVLFYLGLRFGVRRSRKTLQS